MPLAIHPTHVIRCLILTGLSAVVWLGCDSADPDPDPDPEQDPDPIAAPAVTNLTVEARQDGTIGVMFNRSSTESRVSEYRVFVAPSVSAGAFDLSEAQSTPQDRFTVVAKTGGALVTDLPIGTLDIEGEALQRGQSYVVFVMTVADGTHATISALSSASSSVSIPDVAADPVTELTATDVANAGNGSDIEVSFKRAANEATVAEYRIIVFRVPGSFSSEEADALTSGFTSIVPTGQDVNLRLPADAVDVRGNTVENGGTYWVFVLSVADGQNAKVNTLSPPASALTLAVPSADAARGVVIDDVANEGDGSDIEVAFVRAADESTVAEYRVLVVREDDAASFDLATAEQVGPGNYVSFLPNGLNFRSTLPTGTPDSRGRPIENDQTYVVFVLSIADGAVAGLNTLSAPSSALHVAVTTVKVTYLGNDGVMIEDMDGHTVIIDGLQRGIGWVDLTATQTAAIESAVPPYDEVDVAMITHNHGDHYTRSSVMAHVSNNDEVRIVAPPQVRSNLSGIPRVETISPAFHTKEEVVINGVEITVYHLRHFNQFGNDFSNVQNFAYLVRLGGLKLLHLGDVDYATDNLEGLGLREEDVDVVFLPTFNTLLSEANRDVVLDQIDPGLVIGLHFQRTFVGGESQKVLDLYPKADVFTKPLEFRRF